MCVRSEGEGERGKLTAATSDNLLSAVHTNPSGGRLRLWTQILTSLSRSLSLYAYLSLLSLSLYTYLSLSPFLSFSLSFLSHSFSYFFLFLIFPHFSFSLSLSLSLSQGRKTVLCVTLATALRVRETSMRVCVCVCVCVCVLACVWMLVFGCLSLSHSPSLPPTGMNAASTLSCPVIFFCRNNQYAISTPVRTFLHTHTHTHTLPTHEAQTNSITYPNSEI